MNLTYHSATKMRQGRTTSPSACEAPPSRASQVVPLPPRQSLLILEFLGLRLPHHILSQSAMAATHACEANGLRSGRRCCRQVASL